MNTRVFCNRILKKHPLGALYGTLLGIIAFSAAIPMYASGMWDAAFVDLIMAGILITQMLKSFVCAFRKESTFFEKCAAWILLILSNFLVLLPLQDFPESLNTALAFSLLIYAFVLYFSGRKMAAASILPTLWSCVFMPYHEEFMLQLSFPLRLSATVLSTWTLKLCGINVISDGTSLVLPGLNIAITDACSGINQLDAFILIAFLIVQIFHKKTYWKILHFAFIIPALMIGNSLRIVITVLLYRLWGEIVLQNTWHIALGYAQIIFALVIFLVIGTVFSIPNEKKAEEKR